MSDTATMPDPRDPETRSDTWPTSDRARDISRLLEPSHDWWAMPAWLVWRFRQQPRHTESQIRKGHR